MKIKDLLEKIKHKENIGKIFVVEGSILGVLETDPSKVINILDETSNTTLPYNKTPKGDRYKYIINLIMTLCDSAKDKQNNHCPVYLTTNETSQVNPFEFWKNVPKGTDKKAWKNLT